MNKPFLFLFIISTTLIAQLKSPSEFLGYEIGTQFTRHADVVRYFEHVAANSDMVTYQTYGKTNELRPLTYAIVSSAQNISNLESIRLDNLKNAGLIPGSPTNGNPHTAIVWLSYNVHGNEASSTEASMLTIYKLITEKQDWLQNTLVIMDPCVNPDGRDRYVNWYNRVKSTPYNTEQEATEHNEPWPGGRANHYLFDLNRDWAWATQVETRQRLKIYNQWMPQIHVDYHEQGINSPYYFAPAAEPYHEIITPFQREFQMEIGKNNAKYFDQKGRLYFTRERFDLLYPSYGDTYPLYMGAIGMTFEKAGNGRAGLGINTDDGYVLTLIDRLQDHTTTGLSTIEMAHNNAARLNTEFHKFFTDHNTKNKSFVMQGNSDNIQSLAELLDVHQIKYGYTSAKISGFGYANGKNTSQDFKNAIVVSTDQPRGKMVQALFEPNAKLSTPLTYDITAWSLPYAYGLDAVSTTALISANGNAPSPVAMNKANTSAAGYIAKWNSMQDAKFLMDLLKNNIRVRFSEKKLEFEGKSFDRGSLVITRSDNFKNEKFDETIIRLANENKRELYASGTGFSDELTDFGSPDIKTVKRQHIALLQGEGTSSLSYGSLWHFFEQELHYPVTSINTEDFMRFPIEDYDVVVIPNGYYGRVLDDKAIERIKDWVQQGGKLIAFANALKAFEGKEGFDLIKNNTENDNDSGSTDLTKDKDKSKQEKATDTVEGNLTPYDQREKEEVKDLLIGSIYKVTLDPSHPMAFGYGETYYTLKLGSDSYKFLKDGYNVGYIKGDPNSLAGFSGEDAKEGLTNSLVFGDARLGGGSVIYFVDDVLFRDFWQNGKLLFVNSLFFVNNGSLDID